MQKLKKVTWVKKDVISRARISPDAQKVIDAARRTEWRKKHVKGVGEKGESRGKCATLQQYSTQSKSSFQSQPSLIPDSLNHHAY